MNPQSWIALAALVVTVLGALLGMLMKMRQQEAAVDAQIKALGERVQATDARITSVESKFEAKLDALLEGQKGIQTELGALREKMAFERGSQCGIDAQVQALSNSLVTREVFDLRMTAVDREIRDIKAALSDLQKRRG